MELEHTRIQWPVGHGFFHSAEVRIRSTTFRYIYDCGGALWKRCARDYVRELPDGAGVDLLAVSHLHDDHIGGLDFLLAARPVAAVMLPYITEGERLALAINCIGDGTASATFLSFLVNPAKWLLAHGAGSVILVESSDAGPEGTTGNIYHPLFVPPEPVDQDDNRQRAPEPADAPDSSIKLEITPLPANQQPPAQGHTALPTGTHLISHRQALSLKAAGQPHWLFATHVESPDPGRYQAFLDGARRLLRGTGTPRGQVLRRLLEDYSHRSNLRALYRELFPSDFNRTSLCLYSGFGSPTATMSISWRPRWWARDAENQYAWLGTGDARLETPERVAVLARHFGGFLSSVATMTLPHHGSTRNYSPSLITAVKPSLSVVTASGRSSKHPGKAVVADLMLRQQHCHSVTTDPDSILIETVKITDAHGNPT